MDTKTAFARMEQYFGEETKIIVTPTRSIMGWKVTTNLVISYFDGEESFSLFAYSRKNIPLGQNAKLVILIKSSVDDTFEFIQRVTKIAKEVEGVEE